MTRRRGSVIDKFWEKQHENALEYARNKQQNETIFALTAFGVFAIGGAIIGAACSGAVACVAGCVAGCVSFYVIAKYGSDAAESVRSAGECVNDVLQTIKRESQAIAGSLENLREEIFDGIKDCLKTNSRKKQHEDPGDTIKSQDYNPLKSLLPECCLRREK